MGARQMSVQGSRLCWIEIHVPPNLTTTEDLRPRPSPKREQWPVWPLLLDTAKWTCVYGLAWEDAGVSMPGKPESDTEDLITEIWTWRGKS